MLYYYGFIHTLLKFPNTNIFIKAFIKQREYEENLFKINLSQGVTLIKRNNNVSLGKEINYEKENAKTHFRLYFDMIPYFS